MNKSYLFLFIFFIFPFFAQGIFATVAFSAVPEAANCPILSTLRVGSVGEQVKCLQKIVGTSPDGYFGPLTKVAVLSWQLSHNLVADGVVGPLTRTILVSFTVASDFPEGCTQTTTYSPTTGKKCNGSETAENSAGLSPASVSSTNPVVIPGTKVAVGSKMPESLKDPQQNLENYIASVKSDLVKRGETLSTILLIEESIRNSVAENPNATQQFFDAQREIYNKTASGKISKLSALVFFDKVFSFFSKTFSTNKAQAASQLPFGGFVGVFPDCTCTGEPPAVVQLFVTLPSAPTGISNIKLNYATGTQAFLNFNLPLEGVAVLGFYNPAANVACTVTIGTGCGIIPAEGQIIPTVGSSLSPS
ncbi:MAG: peptidoglycan-binding domain-containing protein [Candidatus Paceibacterota bacterium]|jgi:hypothetical protein